MVEKPDAEEAPSNLSVVGRYVLSANLWPLLAKTLPGAGDEIQLTDAIAKLMEKESAEAYAIVGKSHDCGSKLSLFLRLLLKGEVRGRFAVRGAASQLARV